MVENMTNAASEISSLNEFIEDGKTHLKDYTVKGNVIHAQKCFSEAYTLCSNISGKDDIRNIEILSLLSISHNLSLIHI